MGSRAESQPRRPDSTPAQGRVQLTGRKEVKRRLPLGAGGRGGGWAAHEPPLRIRPPSSRPLWKRPGIGHNPPPQSRHGACFARHEPKSFGLPWGQRSCHTALVLHSQLGNSQRSGSEMALWASRAPLTSIARSMRREVIARVGGRGAGGGSVRAGLAPRPYSRPPPLLNG